ncbi:hypothetical protein OKW41_007486 [Paraburkholderia sp. UCT70]|uniref:hypothetical protein n=1 Tax=Paraburkholderia sp. UCT70 TaxID=2991068 RepID=UPI003D1C4135
MPAPKTYTKAQWDEFARRLDALPEKPPSEQRVTVRDAMSKVRAQINGARAKGYSLEQLIDEAKRAGIDITASALRYALQDTKKRRTNTRRTFDSQQPSGKVNLAVTRTVARVSGQPSGTGSRAQMAGDNSKAGSMVMQDAFSFPIAPDTDNL